MLKRNISDVYSHNFMKIKYISAEVLSLEKTLKMHNVVLLIKSIINKYYNHYYYQPLLENC